MTTPARTDLIPSATLLICASAWGLFWIPLRYVNGNGFPGAWSTTFYFLISAVLLLPLIVIRRRQIYEGGFALVLTGLFSGGAIALYTLAFLYTTVAKALLIFYVTPVWSTMLGCLLLREALSLSRVIALVLGLSGLWAILGTEGTVPLPRNIGDFMALTGGLLWAYAAVRLNRSTAHSLEWISTFVLAALVVTVVCLAISGQLVAPPELSAFSSTGFVVVIVLAAASLPANFAILWATNRLSPGRVGLLMLIEVVVGIAAAAVLTDEPFGAGEALGATLILCAAAVDIIRPTVRREARTA